MPAEVGGGSAKRWLQGTGHPVRVPVIDLAEVSAGGGSIVNIGSVNSFLGFQTGSAYVASKHGLIGLTTCVSAELAPQGIRVNLVCPGFIDTPMHRRARGIFGDDLYDNGLLPNVHFRRAGRPDEIARSIVFLCSDEASQTNTHALNN